jgi:hypothetical protein
MKIPKGKSEDLIPRMTDNTIMAKRKRSNKFCGPTLVFSNSVYIF